MGNSTSQAVHKRADGRQSWNNSFPRDPRAVRSVKSPQNKVLPERIPGQRLRVTDNGAILQNGGTLSGRRQIISLGERFGKHDQSPPGGRGRMYRTRSTSTHQSPSLLHNSGTGDGLGKRFGSEPDLRFPHSNHSESPAKQRISRSRKKYKAPAPPAESHGQDSSSPDSCLQDTLDPPVRRVRLFKTRAETKKTTSGANMRMLEQEHASNPPLSPLSQLPSIQRSLSSPEFQTELLQAARRIRSGPPLGVQRESPVGEVAVSRESNKMAEAPLPRLSVNPAPQLPPRKKQEPTKQNPDSHWDIIPPAATLQQERRHDVPVKTFYFGMEHGEREAVDRFAASLQVPPAPCSLSSDDPDEETGGSIALQLRPTLPKKQLEIPRFSPTAAWRLLSTLDAHQPGNASPAHAEEGPIFLEECIQRLSRPVAPLPAQQVLQQQAPRSSHDKSGDSGISGDASPGGIQEDCSEVPAPLCRKPVTQAAPAHPLVMAWTPQQDLEEEEESSSDGGLEVPPVTRCGVVQPKFSPRSHVFSLSLPRDDRLCLSLYADNVDFIAPKLQDQREVQASFNSLKKLRRSVSGVLGAALGGVAVGSPARGEPLDENWVLSRSVPNSLNLEATWGAPTSSPSSPDQDGRPSFSYLASGGHIMYLPEYQARHQTSPEQLTSFGRGRSYSAGVATKNLRTTVPLSKSCDNISAVSEMRQLGRTPSPDRMNEMEVPRTIPAPDKKGKNRRFTFQSTVRQIERRRLAEKLSKEVELKERQRLGELEAMRRVEEEFQKKRAREKASIRQQLRLFSLDENVYCSLPTGWGDTRADPDGAPSSTPSPASGASGTGKTPRQAASTQVLSEFRQPSREYREYRQSRYMDSGPESLMPHIDSKRNTVHHPQVVYDMPKSTQVYVAPHHHQGDTEVSTPRSSSSDNYRKDFAHGARPGHSLASSDSELSQPATRRVSRHQHHSRV